MLSVHKVVMIKAELGVNVGIVEKGISPTIMITHMSFQGSSSPGVISFLSRTSPLALVCITLPQLAARKLRLQPVMFC